MRHDPRRTDCSTCECRPNEITLARGCPRRSQDFIDTQPAPPTLASAPPRVPRHRAPVIIRRSNPVATLGAVFILGVALLSYALLTS